MNPRFMFATCQVGAENLVKEEIFKQFPDAKLAFSRPGLLTVKLGEVSASGEDSPLESDGSLPQLHSVFARTWGYSLGTVKGREISQMVSEVWDMVEKNGLNPVRIHAWPRDLHAVGDYKFEPRLTPESHDVCWKIGAGSATTNVWRLGQETPAARGDLVLDCIILNPEETEKVRRFREKVLGPQGIESGEDSLTEDKSYDREWLIGYHYAQSYASRHPGGMLDLEIPEGIVSRAWLKMEEALRWSRFPLPEDAQMCEIGSAPGGATQALLSRGAWVLGVDPAEMDERVLEHPRFHHIRSRIAAIRRREFRKVRWFTCDINVPPNYALDVMESLVTHPEISVRGMLITLKLPDWELGHLVPEYLSRIRSWGYNIVRARQLHYSHQEICVFALQKPFKKKSPVKHHHSILKRSDTETTLETPTSEMDVSDEC